MELREDKPLCDDNNTNIQKDFPTSQLKGKLLKSVGGLCAFSGALLTAVSLCCTQALGGYVPHFQLNLWRFLAQFFICLIVVACLKKDIRVSRNHIPYVGIVCLAYNVSNVTFYGASVYLALGTQAGFGGTFYLVLTTIISVILKRQCPKLHSVVAVIFVLVSVLLVTQPEILFGDSEYSVNPVCPHGRSKQSSAVLSSSQDDNISVIMVFQLENSSAPESTETAITDPTLGYIYSVIAETSFTVITFTINKRLQELQPMVLSFWVAASGVPISVIIMAIFETPMLPQHCSCQLLLAGHAISVAVLNTCNTVAMILISPQVFSLITNTNLEFQLCAQYTVLRTVNPGHRNVMEIVGGIGVFLGSCVSPIYSLCKEDDEGSSDTEKDENYGK